MSSLEQLRDELEVHDATLTEVEQILAEMPDMEDALEMKAEALQKKKELEAQIAALTKTDSPPAPKWSKENHPAFRKAAATSTAAAAAVSPAPQEHKTFKVNDDVSAKYSGDNSFYTATIVAVTGSASAPIYTVKFKGYNETETVQARHVRALPSYNSGNGNGKRKADGPAVVSSAPHSAPFPSNGSTISAAASIDPALAQKLKDQNSKVPDLLPKSDRPVKKVKPNKALEKSKSSWQDFQKKNAGTKTGKITNKESMFRTGDSATARVGFTGSGATMRKDVARTRHVYEPVDEDN
ncbi:hypothetical protein MBLNU457_4399t1 [Dothideomycetes sp. NU457]